ncbi:MAG: O-antigen ligase family protein [Flavitalea sp.]
MTLPELKFNTKTKILFAAILFAAGTIPFYNHLNSIAMIIFVFACVIQQPVLVTLQRLRKPSLWIWPVLYLAWFVLSYFWDVSGGYAARDIERYASLLFIPTSLAILPKLPRRFVRIACMFFVLVTTLVCVICLVKSAWEYSIAGDYRVFYYHYLSMQLELNAIFLSNYCLASIIWLLYFGFLQRKNISGPVYIIICLTIAFLFGMVMLLSSKLIIFLMFLMLMGFICYIGYLRRFLLKSLIAISIIIVTGVIAVNKLSYLNWRVASTTLKKYSGKEDDNNGLSIRVLMWENAFNLVKKRPLLGYGIRGARQKIVEVYKNENFELGYEAGYHSHNQYLESALMGGIFSLLLFVAMIAKAGWNGFRSENVLLLFMLFHFAVQSMIESTYEVQQEQVFYVFFLFLFYYHSPSLRQNPVNK